MTLPFSGPLSLLQINNEFSRGLNLDSYRGTIWWTEDSQTGTFSSGSISISEFYGKQPAAPTTPGSQDFPFPGNYTFTIPTYSTLIIQVWGAGGGGGNIEGALGGGIGGASTILSLTAGGGQGGANPSQQGGPGGTASGGDINLAGSRGQNGNQFSPSNPSPEGGVGGNSPNGGNGGFPSNNGGFPGAGGGGRLFTGFGTIIGSGGGGGGYVQKTFAPGDLTPGNVISLTVGVKGLGASPQSGSGADGRVFISWN